jgi:hypothetical protein
MGKNKDLKNVYLDVQPSPAKVSLLLTTSFSLFQEYLQNPQRLFHMESEKAGGKNQSMRFTGVSTRTILRR